jgi:hypothetical protein
MRKSIVFSGVNLMGFLERKDATDSPSGGGGLYLRGTRWFEDHFGKINLQLSPATIRNMMAELEELPALPPPSIGRKDPNGKGLRFYLTIFSCP